MFRLPGGNAPWAQDPFADFVHLIIGNVSKKALIDPILGIDPLNVNTSYAQPLLVAGPANNPLFGGGDPQLMRSLEPGSIYDLLIPKNGTIFNVGFNGNLAGGLHLSENEVIYLDKEGHYSGSGVFSASYFMRTDQSPVPEPGAWALMVIGLFSLVFFRSRRT